MATPSSNPMEVIGRYCFLPGGAPGRVINLNPTAPETYALAAEIVKDLRIPVAIEPGSIYVDVNTGEEGQIVFSHQSLNNEYSTVEFYGEVFSIAIEDIWAQRQALTEQLGARVASNQCGHNHGTYTPMALPEVDETEKWNQDFKEQIGQTLKRVEALEALEVALNLAGKRTPEEIENISRLNMEFDKMNSRKKAIKKAKVNPKKQAPKLAQP